MVIPWGVIYFWFPIAIGRAREAYRYSDLFFPFQPRPWNLVQIQSASPGASSVLDLTFFIVIFENWYQYAFGGNFLTGKECLQKNKCSYFVSWRQLQCCRPAPPAKIANQHMSSKPTKWAFLFSIISLDDNKNSHFFTFGDYFNFTPHPLSTGDSIRELSFCKHS